MSSYGHRSGLLTNLCRPQFPPPHKQRTVALGTSSARSEMRALSLLGALCLLRGLLAAPRLSSSVSLMTHPSEERYAKYAVALAATEPLRAERNRAVRSIVGPLRRDAPPALIFIISAWEAGTAAH